VTERKTIPREEEGDEDNGASTELATKETLADAAGTLEKEAARGRHRRHEGLQNFLYFLVIVAFTLVFAVIAVGGILWSYHLFTPECWHFLSDSQLDKIQTSLFSGLASGVAALLARSKFYGEGG
jgi:hypothetical protein